MNVEVIFAHDCIGDGSKKPDRDLPDNQIVMMLENLRFHPGEKKNDPDFARELAELGDVYVNDAFGAMHRAHASVAGLAKLLRQRSRGGPPARGRDRGPRRACSVSPSARSSRSSAAPRSPTRSVCSRRCLTKVDVLFIGGAMAYTFLKAQGVAVGDSLRRRGPGEARRAAPGALPERGLRCFCLRSTTSSPAPRTPRIATVVPPHRGLAMMGLDIGRPRGGPVPDVIQRLLNRVLERPHGPF
jgi:hypothetical protein